MKKYAWLFIFAWGIPIFALGVEHHNFEVTSCRSFQNGNITISGISQTDNQERSVSFIASGSNEKVIDRYLSMCMASLTAGKVLRIDYIDCPNTNCTMTSSTTLNIKN